MTARVSVWSPASYYAVDAAITVLQSWKGVGNRNIKILAWVSFMFINDLMLRNTAMRIEHRV